MTSLTKLEIGEATIAQYMHMYREHIPTEYIMCYLRGRGSDNYHITIVNPGEVKGGHCGERDVDKDAMDALQTMDSAYYVLGLGRNKGCYYLLVNYPRGDYIRKILGLKEPKDFHITLAFNGNDVHDIRKGAATLIVTAATALMDLVLHKSVHKRKRMEYLQDLILGAGADGASAGGRDAEQQRYYIAAVFELAKLQSNSNNHLQALSTIELGKSGDVVLYYYMLIKITQVLHGQLSHGQLSECVRDLSAIEDLSHHSSEYTKRIAFIMDTVNSNLYKKVLLMEKNTLVSLNIPMHVSKILDTDNVYGSGMVTSDNIRGVYALGVRSIITLTEDCLSDGIKGLYKDVTFHHYPTIDRRWIDPDFGIMNSILDKITAKTLVHCVGGVGRTNTVLAAYLVKTQSFSVSDAVKYLDSTRKLILSEEQMGFLHAFYDNIHSVSLPRELSHTVLMVGPPCSGKSTLAELLCKKYPEMVHLSQDMMGKDEVLRRFDRTKPTIIDRCNVTKAQREEWLSQSISSIAIEFDYPVDVLKSRLDERVRGGGKHPTCNSHRVIEEVTKAREPITKDEGFVEVLRIHNADSLESVMSRLHLMEGDLVPSTSSSSLQSSAASSIAKYPRTRHLVNLGSATRDDLVMSEEEANKFLEGEVMVQEKIDGANLGIFIDEENQIRFMNRSHLICSESHEQFRQLDAWKEEHKYELYEILRPLSDILYGEWMFAKHSIHYTALPGYFIAFDMLRDGSFVRFSELTSILKDTTITTVRVIATGKFTLSDIVHFTSVQSAFYDGVVEGVVVRNKDRVNNRCKIVRADFIDDANVHWSSRRMIKNSKAYV